MKRRGNEKRTEEDGGAVTRVTAVLPVTAADFGEGKSVDKGQIEDVEWRCNQCL